VKYTDISNTGMIPDEDMYHIVKVQVTMLGVQVTMLGVQVTMLGAGL
jgi:hypothetical protein